VTDKVPYDLWVKQGWLTLTPGDVVDYAFVIDYINSTAKEYGFIPKELCYDKNTNSHNLWNLYVISIGREMCTYT